MSGRRVITNKEQRRIARRASKSSINRDLNIGIGPTKRTRPMPDYGRALNRIRLFAEDETMTSMYGYVNINGIEHTLKVYHIGRATNGKAWWAGKVKLKHNVI